ncbi:SDR family oxidoreductase [Halobaculum sp. MBLA0147]|uniref:SDR family oxidoreductase n=1 Tax=Halobaculum sp. MBLA0147 TaxID=3079934 RepID=UPI0035261A3E
MTRTVVVGGTGPTIGESVARRFASEGDRVALWARSESFTEEFAADLQSETPGDVIAQRVDVTEPDAVASAVEELHETFGSVDVYVHNTPVPNWSGPSDDDPEALRTTVETVEYGLGSSSTRCSRTYWTVGRR